ncbi:MAG: hypothetical protein ACRD4Y_06065 [Candidatus Acidiferrales bacterium]
MPCQQFEQILEQAGDDALPVPAVAHLEACEACRSLAADLNAIHGAALELGVEELPVPERVWISLRNELEAEHLIRDAAPTAPERPAGWWTAFQRPAMAGAFLSLLVAACGLISYQSGSLEMAERTGPTLRQINAPVLSAENVFRTEAVAVKDELLPELNSRNASVTDSLRRNLSIVDNLIAMCEKSVRDEPDNPMAREYLYGAYEQKAEILDTAMIRGVGEGLQ